jgi:argininosuccinate synthase
MTRIVLGFTGGAADAAAIGWLLGRYGAEVVTLTVDYGQGDELAAIREKALALGAVRAHVIDGREELVRDYLLPAMQAGALDRGDALVYPLLAKRLVDIARMEGAFAVAHCAGAPAVRRVLESEIALLDPRLQSIAAPALWDFSDADLAVFARRQGVPAIAPGELRIAASVWGRRLVAPPGTSAVSSEFFTLTRDADECPHDAALVDVQFAAGVPVSANGIEMSMLELMESLETIAGAHGVGRDVRGATATEAPAARVLSIAYDALEQEALGHDLASLKRRLADVYASTLVEGRWFSDLREAIDAFTKVTRARVSGTVKLRLSGGECAVVSCEPAAIAPASGADSSRAVA